MRLHLVATWIGTVGLGLAMQACVVEPTTPNSGYGYGYQQRNPSYQASANVSFGTPSPYSVSSMPPEPLYENMTASPGYGYAWIDGYWHWNSYEWVWVSGRWDHQQDGYVYVEPYYDYSGGAYAYTPGYWASQDRVPSGWQVRDHRDGRPAVYAPPSGWHNSSPPVRGGGSNGGWGNGNGGRPGGMPPGGEGGWGNGGVRPTNQPGGDGPRPTYPTRPGEGVGPTQQPQYPTRPGGQGPGVGPTQDPVRPTGPTHVGPIIHQGPPEQPIAPRLAPPPRPTPPPQAPNVRPHRE